ncbi:MAG TPA: type I methionyl aminopeptidase [Acidimicrobiia bacterium]|nr:type I methionyl aminopeptidase [Acidimicrobiia bacterium]
MITLKSEREFSKMAVAGRCVGSVLDAVRAAAVPGKSLLELDQMAGEIIAAHGCTPSFLGYQPSPHQVPYPGHLCLSVNDVIVHGVPSAYRLREGDILSVDAGAIFEGFHGDAAFTMPIGEVSPEAARLIAATAAGMWAGIGAVRTGNRLGDIGAAVQRVGEGQGLGIVREYVGHGIGRSMHEEPQVSNLGTEGRGLRIKNGMALCIEPMFNLGGWETSVDGDGWTVRTADGSLSAHFEHTVILSKDGPMVTTVANGPVPTSTLAVTGPLRYHSQPVSGTL